MIFKQVQVFSAYFRVIPVTVAFWQLYNLTFTIFPAYPVQQTFVKIINISVEDLNVINIF
jgi:hypothetical protein